LEVVVGQGGNALGPLADEQRLGLLQGTLQDRVPDLRSSPLLEIHGLRRPGCRHQRSPSPASTSAMCSTRVVSSPRRRKRPSILSRQPRLPPTTASAPTLAIEAHLRSTICVEMSPNLTANAPPKPQHSSLSGISSR